jgi:predicted metal-dependent HD superfamily phosphohydrolase
MHRAYFHYITLMLICPPLTVYIVAMDFNLSNLETEIDNARLSLVQAGVELMAKKYGADGLQPLPYHDDRHALEVIEASALIGRAISLDRRTLGNLLVAAAFHDVVHDMGPKNEERSAEVALQHMDAYPAVFHDSDRRQVASLIMATKVLIRDSKLVQLTFVDQAELTDVHKALADADLSNFGRPRAYSGSGRWICLRKIILT